MPTDIEITDDAVKIIGGETSFIELNHYGVLLRGNTTSIEVDTGAIKLTGGTSAVGLTENTVMLSNESESIELLGTGTNITSKQFSVSSTAPMELFGTLKLQPLAPEKNVVEILAGSIDIEAGDTTIICSEAPLTVSGGLNITKGSANANAIQNFNTVTVSADNVSFSALGGSTVIDNQQILIQGANMAHHYPDENDREQYDYPTETIRIFDGINIEGRNIVNNSENKISVTGQDVILSGSNSITLQAGQNLLNEGSLKVTPGLFEFTGEIMISLTAEQRLMSDRINGGLGREVAEQNSLPVQTNVTGISQNQPVQEERSFHMGTIATTPAFQTETPGYSLSIVDLAPVSLENNGKIYLYGLLNELVQSVNFLQARVKQLTTQLNNNK